MPMPAPFPSFLEPTPLADGTAWTAEFVSYDQRTDSAYYCIRWAKGDGEELWARVHCDGVPDREQLFADVQDVVQSGESNTDHRGGMVWFMKNNPPPGRR